jgi:hypothetical protein
MSPNTVTHLPGQNTCSCYGLAGRRRSVVIGAFIHRTSSGVALSPDICCGSR